MKDILITENIKNYKNINIKNLEKIKHKEIGDLVHVDILIDNGWMFSYSFELPLCILFRNSYDENVNRFIPLTVSDRPRQVGNATIKISRYHFLGLIRFIQIYKKQLIDYSNNKNIPRWHCDYFDPMLTKNLNEETKLLLEEPSLSKGETGLPMDIWIDDGKTYERGGHWKRLKFNDGNGTHTNGWAAMTIPDKKILHHKEDRNTRVLQKFYDINDKMINDVMDGKLPFDYLKHYLTKVDKHGNAITEPETYIYHDAGYNGYKIITNTNTGKFSIIDQNKNMITDKWFDSVNMFMNYGKHGLLSYCTDENNNYLMDVNGNIRNIDSL